MSKGFLHQAKEKRWSMWLVPELLPRNTSHGPIGITVKRHLALCRAGAMARSRGHVSTGGAREREREREREIKKDGGAPTEEKFSLARDPRPGRRGPMARRSSSSISQGWRGLDDAQLGFCDWIGLGSELRYAP
jgi:hypothetical protein